MKRWFEFLLLTWLACFLVSVACKPGPSKLPREQTRSVVLTIAEGVRVADEACASIARARRDLRLAEACDAVVTEARTQLLTAEEAVDAWDAADGGKLACAARSASSALSRLLDTLAAAGARIPPAIDDALRLAPALTGACRG